MQPTTRQLASDIERELRKQPSHELRLSSPPTIHSPTTMPEEGMPEYVEHREGASEIGMLSAEAVVREYEAAAKEIEAMGADLVERAKQCEAVTAGALAVTEELKEVAARYRAEAKRVFDHIENCSSVVAEVRKTCTDLRDRITAPLAMEKLKRK